VTDRRSYTYLEALAACCAALRPGSNPAPPEPLRAKFADLARRGISAAVDPASPDFMNFNQARSQSLMRHFSPWRSCATQGTLGRTPRTTQTQVLTALRSSRVIQPGFNNWLLFSATIEAFLCRAGEDWDKMRVDYAIRQHEQWFKGDGIYGDGAQFHCGYSRQLRHSAHAAGDSRRRFHANQSLEQLRRPHAATRAAVRRHPGAADQPGRHLPRHRPLARLSLRKPSNCSAKSRCGSNSPVEFLPEQVRPAMTAVIRRMIEAPGTFDRNGWLTIGFCGHQPSIGETYISTGSLYLCAAGLLPLGLPANDPFWTSPARPWTSQKAWGGTDLPVDHAL
jgi:hypothetical protein